MALSEDQFLCTMRGGEWARGNPQHLVPKHFGPGWCIMQK